MCLLPIWVCTHMGKMGKNGVLTESDTVLIWLLREENGDTLNQILLKLLRLLSKMERNGVISCENCMKLAVLNIV